jgi:hypothetical protein
LLLQKLYGLLFTLKTIKFDTTGGIGRLLSFGGSLEGKRHVSFLCETLAEHQGAKRVVMREDCPSVEEFLN